MLGKLAAIYIRYNTKQATLNLCSQVTPNSFGSHTSWMPERCEPEGDARSTHYWRSMHFSMLQSGSDCKRKKTWLSELLRNTSLGRYDSGKTSIWRRSMTNGPFSRSRFFFSLYRYFCIVCIVVLVLKSLFFSL